MNKDTITWVNSMGYGDCHWTAQYLTKLGGHHILHCRENHHEDLRSMFPSIEFRGMDIIPENAIDSWIGAQCDYSWHSRLLPRDLIDFLGTVFFDGLSKRIGVQNPIRNREDMLYDCPITRVESKIGVFFVNTHPRSGQVSNFTEEQMGQLNALMPRPSSCSNSSACGAPLGNMLSHAIISQTWSAIAGVATGPIWPCLSKQNAGKPIYLLLDQVHLDYGPTVPIFHFSNVQDMAVKLKEDGWL